MKHTRKSAALLILSLLALTACKTTKYSSGKEQKKTELSEKELQAFNR